MGSMAGNLPPVKLTKLQITYKRIYPLYNSSDFLHFILPVKLRTSQANSLLSERASGTRWSNLSTLGRIED